MISDWNQVLTNRQKEHLIKETLNELKKLKQMPELTDLIEDKIKLASGEYSSSLFLNRDGTLFESSFASVDDIINTEEKEKKAIEQFKVSPQIIQDLIKKLSE